MQLTDNQQGIFGNILKLYTQGIRSTHYIDAVGGSGKTFIIGYLIGELDMQNYLYTAYNTGIVKSGVAKLGKSHCKTFHAFARRYIENPNIGFLSTSAVKLKSYPDKELTIEILDTYFVSEYKELGEFLESLEEEVKSSVVNEAYRILTAMSNWEIPITFNYMLKELHYQMANGFKIELDALFVDECQDMTPVMIEIFNLVDCKLKVFLGDAQQSIYDFLGLKSVFDSCDSSVNMYNSFRLTPELGAYVQRLMRRYVDYQFNFIGCNPSVESDGSELYLTFSNSALLMKVSKCQDTGVPYRLVRSITEITKLPLKVEELLCTGETDYPPLFTLSKLLKRNSPTSIVKNCEDELSSSVFSALKLVLAMGRVSIAEILDRHENTENALLISTTHAVKGLEACSVTHDKEIKVSVEKAMIAISDGFGTEED